MKILGIGDLHGRRDWERALARYRSQTDGVVFLGDYFDSFHQDPDTPEYDPAFSAEAQIQNFLAIAAYAQRDPDCVLLLGNHENQYIKGPSERCLGYQERKAYAIHMALMGHRRLLRAAWQHGNWIFTHAGVSGELHLHLVRTYNVGLDSVAEAVEAAYNRYDLPLFHGSPARDSADPWPGCFWMHWGEESRRHMWSGLNQCVGHTAGAEIRVERTQDGLAVAVNTDVWPDCPRQVCVIDTESDEVTILPND